MDRGLDLVTELSGINERQQEILLEFYAKSSENIRIRAHTAHREILNMLYREEGNSKIKKRTSLDVLSYISFLLAIKIVYLDKYVVDIEQVLSCKLLS